MQTMALVLFAFVDTLFGFYLVAALFGLVFGGIVPSYALATRWLFPASTGGKPGSGWFSWPAISAWRLAASPMVTFST